MSGLDSHVADFARLAADGAVVEDPCGFMALCTPAERLQLATLGRRAPGATSYELVDLGAPRAQLVAVASLQQAARWQGAPGAWSAASEGVGVCRLSMGGVSKRLAEFGEAFGLPPAVVRVVNALYETCDVKQAAASAGVSFNTAREYLTKARAAIWAPNLPRLVTWAAVGSMGIDASGESDVAIGALFSLSERQRRLAGLVADGASRTEAAQAMAVSDALAKKELAAVFDATGVTNSIGLARLFAELRGLAILAREAPQHAQHPPPLSRNLFISVGDGRRVAVSDYGPDSGKPVLVLHNTMNCRGVDRALVSALQNAGYRPLSPDRPGYGDTDPAPEDCTGERYLDVCADDIAALCAEMGWSKVPLIAHGPVHLVLALMRRWPDLIEKALIDAPEPDSAWGTKAQGMMPSLKRQFARRPWAVASVIRILAALASYDRVAAFMQEWTARSPADRRAMDDPALMMDFYRKLAPFQHGKTDGFIREQVLQATCGRPAPIADAHRLTLLIGATDFMHNARETETYWRSVLKGARFVVIPDAGRFISYSNPDRLVAELQRPSSGRAAT